MLLIEMVAYDGDTFDTAICNSYERVRLRLLRLLLRGKGVGLIEKDCLRQRKVKLVRE